jgi:DNA-binding transcriptional regulator YbjK
MVTRAQLSQERSRQRRDALLSAAIELFAEGGSRAVTHRAVAARAGLPSATTTYYFESIDALIREALAAHVIQWIHELDTFASREPATVVDLDKTERFIKAVFSHRGPEAAAVELSIFLATAREPELHDLAATVVESMEALVTVLLHRAGVPDARDTAASIAALIGGTALRRQAGHHSEEHEAHALALSIRDLIAARLLGVDVVDSMIAGLYRQATSP